MALLHASAEREFTHGRKQQDPTLQDSLVAYVTALSRSTCADKNRLRVTELNLCDQNVLSEIVLSMSKKR